MNPRFHVAALACALFLAGARVARAQDADSVSVRLTLDRSTLAQPELQQALEHELGVPVRFGASQGSHLEIAIHGRHAEVSYYAPRGTSVTRRIDLPADRARANEAIAFLVGNLARDQAGDLLEGLKPHPSPEAKAPDEAQPDAPATSDQPKLEEPGSEPKKPEKPAEKPAEPANTAKPTTAPAPSPNDTERPLEARELNLSFFYPITLLHDTRRLALGAELGFGYSDVGAIGGVGFTLGYLRARQRSRGVLLGLGAVRSDALDGAAVSAFVSYGSGKLRGLDAAGLVALRPDGHVGGAHLAGLVSMTGGLLGAQAAGIYAYAQELEGGQIGGLMAYSQRVEGFQGAGLLSLAGDVNGLQVATVDVANDVHGVQIGAVSVGRKVDGLQVGVVNVSREIHGGALGLVNIAGNGSVAPTVWGSGPDGSLNVGLKFHTDYTYALAGVGSNASGDRVRYELGTGAHIPLGPIFFGEVGASYGERMTRVNERVHTDRSEIRTRVTLGAHPLPWFEPFAGAGLVTRVTGTGSDVSAEYLGGIALPINL